MPVDDSRPLLLSMLRDVCFRYGISMASSRQTPSLITGFNAFLVACGELSHSGHNCEVRIWVNCLEGTPEIVSVDIYDATRIDAGHLFKRSRRLFLARPIYNFDFSSCEPVYHISPPPLTTRSAGTRIYAAYPAYPLRALKSYATYRQQGRTVLSFVCAPKVRGMPAFPARLRPSW